MTAIFSLDSAGYFQQDGRRIFPVGVNYWPASCGVDMWLCWPADEIQRDLDIVADLGLNTVRFFLRWQDFEPVAGEYDPVMFERLAKLMDWLRQRRLLAHPSLFVGWMSGGIFWPRWRKGRNVFTDAQMREHAFLFARACAQELIEYRDITLAIDQGNELCCLPDSHQAPPESVINWCREVNAAIRSVWPDVLMISGNEQSQVTCDSGWRFGQQPGCDLYSMHAYPVPGWHPISIDGMADPLTQSLLPFYVQCARAFGPVMVQEFGTILTFDSARQNDYLRHILPACHDAGANGFLWWCLRDVTAQIPPYLDHAFEGTLGLVDAEGRVKSGLEYFVEFARDLQKDLRHTSRMSVMSERIGLYWPEYYYHRQANGDGPNRPADTASGLLLANYFMRKLGYETQVIRGDAAIPESCRILIMPGCVLTSSETQRLTKWVKQGGRLLWHGVDPHNFGKDCIELLGAVPIDYRAPNPLQVDVFGHVWMFDRFPSARGIEVRATTAHVIAESCGRPALLRHDLGQGRVVCALPLVEQMIATFSGDRARRDHWLRWYQGVLQLLMNRSSPDELLLVNGRHSANTSSRQNHRDMLRIGNQ